MTLYYTVPEPIKTPFAKGEIVEVCDRDLKPMGEVKVKYAGKKIVRLVDGRTFRATDGWYLGHKAWPFPSIRHKKEQLDDCCEACGIGFRLPSGRCDHCNLYVE